MYANAAVEGCSVREGTLLALVWCCVDVEEVPTDWLSVSRPQLAP